MSKKPSNPNNIRDLLSECKAAPGRAASVVISNARHLAAESNEATALTGRHVERCVVRQATETKEAVALTGRHVERCVVRQATETKEAVALTGQHVEKHSDANHKATRGVISGEANATREEVRVQHDRTRDAIKELNNDGGWGEKFFCFIIAIISGIGIWFAENNIFYRVVEFDKHGNPLRYATDPVNRIIVCVACALVIYFGLRLLVHAIRKHFR